MQYLGRGDAPDMVEAAGLTLSLLLPLSVLFSWKVDRFEIIDIVDFWRDGEPIRLVMVPDYLRMNLVVLEKLVHRLTRLGWVMRRFSLMEG